MVILVLNCGSSSIKYQVIDMEAQSSKLLAKGLVERIGLPEGDLTHKPVGKEKFELHQPIPDHTTGISLVLQALTDPVHGVIRSLDEVKAVGHRVAHGGEFFPESCLVTKQVQEKIRSLFQIAPLHNPANLEGILSIEKVLPGVKQVAVFDTSFHQTLPATNFMYALPYEMYEELRIRRYGFHGTSHRYVSEKAIEYLGRGAEGTKIVTCHLGNGSSISAVKDGKVIDTSMGFTPLEGIIMGSRCGSIDPAIVPFIMEKENIPASEMGNFMNKQCGLLGVSEVSSDLRDVMAAVRAGNKQAKLAYDILCYGIKKYIGSYAAAMNGLDCVVFTAGIGENTPEVRAGALEEMDYLGIRIDPEKNANVKKLPAPCDISADGSRVRVYVIPTNEELVIASDTEKLVSAL